MGRFDWVPRCFHISKAVWKATLVSVSSGCAFVLKVANPVYSAAKVAIYAWTEALHQQLRRSPVAVYEIVTPLVAVELTPGQPQVSAALPLDDVINEVMELLWKDRICKYYSAVNKLKYGKGASDREFLNA
ncbi:SDR family NAD(P)-dependent oxidoreductase [Pseudoruegeria sp. SK021]|uniref:SDR family NAD(P)-dependent oxidoreductase n=1 Tax=Pseudoruegeria sp. SK021 TaxID=1933035 RepID=UPI000A245AA5|nr:SDR family NAD(P)-dependent oxidoreductase [Pseudoruegeria sp. SK021]OSP53385.1 hypothetical protein BV911_18315 [Pseudoruegeria sp. SK021]